MSFFNPIQKYYMPDEVVGLQITADAGPATTSVKSFREQLKQATQDVIVMNEKFGTTSTEAVNAAKRVAELKDQMQDAKSLADAFNPDKKFQAFSGALQTVTGGFSALTGAMALFGVESEDVQKTLLKVQAALAISEGVNSVLDGVQAFKNLSAVVQQSTLFIKANTVVTNLASGAMKLFGVSVDATSVSFRVLKTAIAATGIGLLIVALGAAYEAFENFSSAAQKAADAQKDLNDQTLKGAKAQLDGETAYLQRQEQIEIAKAKAAGASEEAIYKIQNDYGELKLASRQRYAKEVGELDESAAQAVKQQETQNQIDLYNQQAAANDKRQQQLEKANAKATAAKQKAADDEARIEEQMRQRQAQAVQDWLAFVQNGIQSRQQLAQSQAEQDAADQKARDDYYQQQVDQDNALVMQKIANDKAQTEAAEELARVRTEIRERELDAAANLFAAASELAGQQTAAGKILAIAATTINTYKSATAAYAGMVSSIPGPVGIAAGIVAAAASVAMGIANVKRILSVKVPGAAGGGSTPSISTNAPLSPTLPATQTSTTVNQDSINKMGQANSKVYVLSSDVTNDQQRNAMLNRQARIG